MNLKELRTQKGLSLADVVKDFRYIKRIHGSRLTRTLSRHTLYCYENPEKENGIEVKPEMFELLKAHIETLEPKKRKKIKE